MLVVTNNPMVERELKSKQLCPVEYVETSFEGLLINVRDRVHKGHKLLTHPLSGSVKPNETHYKSIGISDKPGQMDTDSLLLIEQALDACRKFPLRYPVLTERMQQDFQTVDLTLILSVF